MSFAEIVGHAREIEFLRRALESDRISHALLFAGAVGIGKRRVADAVAAAVVCERRGTDACGECDGCRQLAAGSHPDVTVVEVPSGKREIPIDSVRQLNQFLRLQRLRASRRVAIIDDAHLLNLPAQNALLKGLEEPPAGSLMILVAPSPDALLPTIRSRCQRLSFGPLPDDLLRQVLVERLALTASEADEILPLAEGSPGRALRLKNLFPAETRERVLRRLAHLEGSRYGALVLLATEVAGSEELTSIALESLLRQYRDASLQSAAADDLAAVSAIGRRAGLVTEALGTLRRRNANRQLLLESLFARLARA